MPLMRMIFNSVFDGQGLTEDGLFAGGFTIPTGDCPA